jgi:hypothetical protein
MDFGAEHEMVEAFLLANRCCAAPALCGVRCLDDAESEQAARVARCVDDLRARLAQVRRDTLDEAERTIHARINDWLAAREGKTYKDDDTMRTHGMGMANGMVDASVLVEHVLRGLRDEADQ